MDFLPGFIQGITRVTISYPFDAIKVYSQNNGEKPLKNLINNFKTNKSSFYRGASIIYISVSLERSIQFKFFENLNKKYNPFISGLLITLPLSIFTVPSQCITNNIILRDGNGNGNFQYIKSYIKQNGFSSLYKGYFAETIRYVGATSIYLGIYGNMRKENSSKLEIATNSLTASYSSWLISYPIDLIKTLIQTDKNWKNTIKNRIKNSGFFCLWNGISPVLVRTAPSSIIGMLVYEYSRETFR